MRQLNNHFGRRCATTPMAVHRVKVTFKDEPGEGSGVARSFYTAIAQAFLSNEKLPNLDCIQNANKGTHTSKDSTDNIHNKVILCLIETVIIMFLCVYSGRP